MSAAVSAVVDLRKQSVWDPGLLLAAAFHWPGPWELQRLDDVGTRLGPQTFVAHGTQVVTPDGVDRVHGGIRQRTARYQGSAHLVGGDPANLQPDDVLIPGRADIPALMVGSDMLGSTVSSGFSAYRFPSREGACWVWAVLSSTTGQRYRRSHTVGSLSAQRPRIGDAALPWPDDESRAQLMDVIEMIEQESRKNRMTEAAETWWSTVDLRRVAWRMALAAPEPERLLDGVPLGQLCTEINVGRPFDRSAAQNGPAEGLLPVVTGSALAGRRFTRWLPVTPASLIAEAGDVLVAASGERANARVADQRSIIDSGVYRVRLKDRRHAVSIAAFLNGQKGYGFRRLLLAGTTVPRITKSDLESLPVPRAVLEGMADGPVEPLSEQLERVLWNR